VFPVNTTGWLAIVLALGAGYPSGPAAIQNGQAVGKVIEVSGDRITIALESGGVPKAGFLAEVSLVDAQGTAQLVGVWRVVDVRRGEVTAEKIEALSPPEVGAQARIFGADAIPAPDSNSRRPPWQSMIPGGGGLAGSVFPEPPAGAFVSTRGYLIKLPDGSFQDGFDNFKRWAASRGPRRETMLDEYTTWRSGSGRRPFSGLWVERNDYVLPQTYATAQVGLVVLGVCPGSSGEKAGITVGDIVLKVNGAFVRDTRLLSEAAGTLLLEIERDSRLLRITLRPERHD
jgi:hypothetical protein